MKKDTKKRILVWLLMLSLLLPLPGMTNVAHAEPTPTPPSPPSLTEVIPDSGQSNHLIMWCSGWGPEGWGHMWRLSTSPDMMSPIWDDFTDEYVNSVEFSESLLNLIEGMMVYLAARYFHGSSSDIVSGWSNIYSVEIDDNGAITNVELYDDSPPPPGDCLDSPNGEHEWETEVTKEPTCTETGVKSTRCKHCGKQNQEEIPALGHQWERKVKEEASCTEPGVASMVCKRCGLEKSGSEETIDPLGHQWERKVKEEATCTEPGVASMVCSRCGQEKPGSEETIDPLGHQWKRKVKEEATCTEPGVASMVCKRCGQEKPGSEEMIDPLGHNWVTVPAKMPTATEFGQTEGVRCDMCETWLVTPQQLPKLGSEGSEHELTVEPSVWTQGSNVSVNFTPDTGFADFSHVTVDDEIVDESNYDTREGSTTIAFRPAFLETMPVGTHTVKMVSPSGTARGALEIKASATQDTAKETQPGDTVPVTGEDRGNYPWPALTLLAAGGILLLLRKRRLSRQKS